MSFSKKYTIFFLLLIPLLSHARDIPSDGKIQGRLNIVNGASAECVMHHFYTQTGWIQIEGEIGRNGIDGLYYKKRGNTIREVLVAESKWNTSRLSGSGKNKAVRQMSQEWVLRTLDKLVKKLHIKTYSTIQEFIKHDQYRARIFRLKPVGDSSIQITTYAIKNKGFKLFDEIKAVQLKPIDINKPVNSFEEGIVTAYNECRKKYLNKYIDILSENEIIGLLKDNYLQKSDIKSVLGAL